MENEKDPSIINSKLTKNKDLPDELAYVEYGPKDKPPRKIPVIKIIIYALILLIIASVLIYALMLVRNRERFQKISKDVTSEVESKLKAYPRPLPNTCGEDVLMCPGGGVVEKNGPGCEFTACSEFSTDLTKFWNVTNSKERYIRTYKNLDLKYEFNLVKNWDFIGLDYGFILYSPNYNCENGVVISDSKCDGSIIEMLSSNTTGINNVEDWYKSNENYFLINSDNPPPENYKLTSVDGIKAIEVDNTLNTKSIYFIYDNSVFALKLTSATETDYKNSLKELNNILATFKFTDKPSNN